MKTFSLCVSLILSLIISTPIAAESKASPKAQTISGEVRFDQKVEGTLFIFVRYLKLKRINPVAVKMYENPQFPLKFKLSAQNAIAPGSPFKGPFKVIAKLTPVGSSGWEKSKVFAKGATPDDQSVEVGDHNIVIELK